MGDNGNNVDKRRMSSHTLLFLYFSFLVHGRRRVNIKIHLVWLEECSSIIYILLSEGIKEQETWIFRVGATNMVVEKRLKYSE